MTKWVLIAMASLLVTGGAALTWRFGFYVAPYAWTQEPERLAKLLGVRPGYRIADIGAGDGALAAAMSAAVGPDGVVFATELSDERRAEIEARRTRDGVANLRPVAAAVDATNLPSECCEAVYMRAMFHHVADRAAFAEAAARTLKPRGRLAVIDFAPGTLWFHGDDHGVAVDVVIEAFTRAGLTTVTRVEKWGGGMFLVLFERRT